MGRLTNFIFNIIGLFKKKGNTGFVEKLQCDHDWGMYAYDSIQCRNCDKIKYDPKKNKEFMNNILSILEGRGENVDNLRIKSDIYN